MSVTFVVMETTCRVVIPTEVFNLALLTPLQALLGLAIQLQNVGPVIKFDDGWFQVTWNELCSANKNANNDVRKKF